MILFLIIVSAGVVMLGYLVMCRIDHFIERGGILESPQGRANQGVLVYGAPDVAEKINKMGMKCRNITAQSYPEDGCYSILFALSDEDKDNLAICHDAKSTDPGIAIVARCNTPNLRDIFINEGVDRLLSAGEPIDSLLTELWGADKGK
ncbi:NAD-binding protein [Eubacteriales bacterium mix99]